MSSSTQSCSVPLYTVMVSSGASSYTLAVTDSSCTTSSCSYILGMSGDSITPYNVSVACRNTLNQTGQPYVTMQSELGCCHVTSCHHGYLPSKVFQHLYSKLVSSM